MGAGAFQVEAMGQVPVNVNGRSYRFECGDGEEARLHELAAYIKNHIDALTREYGNVGDERLLLTAALLITDELLDARAAVAAASAATAAKPAVNGQANAPLNGQASGPPKIPSPAERREQDPIRSEYRRKMAAGEA